MTEASYSTKGFDWASFPLAKDDYAINDNHAVCPECGNEMQIDMCDMPHNANDGYEWEETCSKCETKFKVTMRVSVSFKSEWNSSPPSAPPTSPKTLPNKDPKTK